MKKWYEYNIRERYENVYNNFSIEDFWAWWSDNEDVYMEVRVKNNFHLIDDYSKAYSVPRSPGSLYINQAWQLEKVIKFFNSHQTNLWFALNPKRKLIDKYGRLRFSGKDINISKIKFLFLDIDRVVKKGSATSEDLMNADFLADNILEHLSQGGFNKNHIKICSGNGVQLFIKLDVPVELPMPDYDEALGQYIESALFSETKQLIKKGIGKVLPLFSNKFKNDYGVEIDSTGFNVGRVGALHSTFNYKYENPVPRGIVELKQEGANEGLSDYLRQLFHDKKVVTKAKSSIKEKTTIILAEEHTMIKNELRKNVIIDLMLKHKFPDGGINNTLWYGVKLLLHNSGIDTSDKGYRQLHQTLSQIHNRGFSENGLEPNYNGNYNGSIKQNDMDIVPPMVNKYLRLHKIERISNNKTGYHKPIFLVSPRGKKCEDVTVNISLSLLDKSPEYKYKLNNDMSDPLDDIKKISNKCYNIRYGDEIDEKYKKDEYHFNTIGVIMVKHELKKHIIAFVHALKDKWGLERAVYMIKYYMDDYLNYKRW